MLAVMTVEDAANLVNRTHGQLANAKKVLKKALAERATTPGRKAAECGTEAGYVAHHRAGVAACAACTYARWWENERRKLRRSAAS